MRYHPTRSGTIGRAFVTHKKKKSRQSPSASSLTGSKSGKDGRNRLRKPRISFETPPHSTGDQQDQNHSQAKRFPIVGIGASAGGFEAFTKFLAAMPGDIGMAFVLVQQEDPDHASLIPDVLATYTSLPIETVSDHTPVENNHVYVIPPNANLTIKGGILQVTQPPQAPGLRNPIDNFFRSLSEDQGPCAICIILSGSGSDGISGLRAVKEHGGMSIVQAVETATFDSMPKCAILAGVVDHILTVDQMPGVLMAYAQYLHGLAEGKGLDSLRKEALNCVETICAHLKRQTGHDFHQYKTNTLSRRIRRRMQILHMNSASQYVERIREDPDETAQLFKDLLIGVTQFFRDPEAFSVFSRNIFPKITASKKPGESIRIWVPGCSTGEEAYSIAMLLYEHLNRNKINISAQIFATDIDEGALSIARSGCYPKKIADHMTADRLSQFFVKDGSFYRVVKAIRDMCNFSPHNLISDPPFCRMDVISCRNLLIYMDAKLHAQIFSVFHYSLHGKGYLFLGSSENAAGCSHLFRSVNKRHRIFQAKGELNPVAQNFPLRRPQELAQRLNVTPSHRPQETISQYFDRVVRQDYGPAAVLIDRESHVQYISGQTRKYLQLPSGSLNVNLLNMVTPDLRMKLRSAIAQTLKTRKEVIQENIRLSHEHGIQHLDVIVRPLTLTRDESELLMVIFRDQDGTPSRRKITSPRKTLSRDDKGVIRDLEHEITTLTQHLASTVDELELSNQDLVSSNEELLSVNEELQSTNEELQTSTEELQSVNEELGTINIQLESKVEELDQSKADIENFFRSTDIATVFLDKHLRIKKFTPAAQTLFRFLEIDVGRPISDLASFFQDSTLRADIEEVLRTSHSKEKERLFPHGSLTYLSRIIPYRTPENQVEGVVLTFVDITRLRQVENQVLQFSRQQAVIGAFGQFSLQEYDLQKVMDECVRQIVSVLPVEFAKVLELRPDGKSFLLRAGRGWKEGLVGHTVIGVEGDSQAGYTLSVNEPVIVTDLSQEKRFSGPSLLIDHHVVSGMSCIIRDREGNPHGVLGVHSSLKRKFSADDVQFLQTIAHILASAIHRKGVENQLQAVKDSLEVRVKDRTTELVQHQHRVRQLTSQLMLTEQRERRRIAMELHDDLGQLLVVGKMQVSQIEHAGLADSSSRIVRELEESLDSALTYTRDLISQLSPPVLYEFGLMKAIPWLAEKMTRFHLQVTVTSHPDDESLLFPESVSVLVYQVLRELLLNVVKHGQTHEACIEITRLSHELVGFEVMDRGCGFDPQPLRDTIAQSQKFGLLNVRERIEGIGGQVTILSKKGEGTRVQLTVPVSFTKAPLETSPFPALSVDSRLRQKEKGVSRVLLADDHAMFREGMRTLLETCPDIHVVGEAENGEQANSLAHSLQPDVVVMDINMPVMNGIEATRLIKQRLPVVYVIGLSMHSDQIVKKAFFDAGGDHYVTKGDSFDSFAELIRASQKGSLPTE